MNLISDENVHSLDDEFYYILKTSFTNHDISNINYEVNEFIDKSLDKYCEYIFKNHPNFALEKLKNYIHEKNNFNKVQENIKFIFKPCEINDPLGLKTSLCMKFKINQPTG